MSLLDSFLRDALLQTVVQSDVYVAIRADNPNSGSGYATPIGSGSGTMTDPYGGPADTGDWFDYVMANYAGTNKTVRIGPGIFRTKGATGTATGTPGWTAASGMRLLGAGVAQTILKLAGTDNQQRYAIAMPASSTGLLGFEASDFTIDAGYGTGSGTIDRSQGAVSVFGAHILLKRIRAVNFGGDLPSGSMKVFQIGVAGTPSGTENIEDCVLDEISLESPGSLGANTSCILISFGGTTTNPHRFSVARNCYLRVAKDADSPPIKARFHGISPGAGLGTILEGNEISNLENAIYDPNGSDYGKDLVIRNNYCHNVLRGVYFNRTTGVIGRIIATENVIDLGTVAGSLTDARGINLTGTGGTRYTTLVLRKNVIRDFNNPTGTTTGLYGINVSYGGDVNVESNVINSAAADKAVLYGSCTATKFFNNETSAGALLRGYDGTKYALELEDAVQDVLLAL